MGNFIFWSKSKHFDELIKSHSKIFIYSFILACIFKLFYNSNVAQDIFENFTWNQEIAGIFSSNFILSEVHVYPFVKLFTILSRFFFLHKSLLKFICESRIFNFFSYSGQTFYLTFFLWFHGLLSQNGRWFPFIVEILNVKTFFLDCDYIFTFEILTSVCAKMTYFVLRLRNIAFHDKMFTFKPFFKIWVWLRSRIFKFFTFFLFLGFGTTLSRPTFRKYCKLTRNLMLVCFDHF